MIKESLIIFSDDDQPIVSYLSSGFDDSFNFVVCLEKEAYIEDDLTAKTRRKITLAIVNKDETYELAKKLNVHLIDLPKHLSDEFDNNIVNPSLSQVSQFFSEVLSFLQNHGVHYTIEEKYSEE